VYESYPFQYIMLYIHCNWRLYNLEIIKLGKFFEKLRKDHGMTREMLAESADLDLQTIKDLESENCGLTIEELQELIEQLKAYEKNNLN